MLLGDNTVKELKNQFLILYAANLISRRKFRMVTFQFLRKSHTHDKIDALWGVIARRISNETRLLDADSTVAVVQQELQRPGLRQWVGSTTELNISKFDSSRDWKTIGLQKEPSCKVDYLKMRRHTTHSSYFVAKDSLTIV